MGQEPGGGQRTRAGTGPRRRPQAGRGPRPSEVRRHAGVLTPEQRASRLAERLARWLALTRELPRTRLTLGRAQVEALRSLLGDHLPALARRVQDAERRIAEARRRYLAAASRGRGRAARALHAVLQDLRHDTHAPRIDPAKVADDFRTLVETRGTAVLWNSIELALDLPGYAVAGCPLAPGDAVAVLARRYGFATPGDCLRFLRRERAARARRRAAIGDPVLSALRRLP